MEATGGNSEEEGEGEESVVEEDEEEEGEEEEEGDEEDKREASVEFSVGELVWGAARGHPSLPGKVVPAPSGGGSGGESASSGKRSVWVRWFGGRPVIELVPLESLKSLSEGLEAHHSALKDTRK